MDEGYVFRVAVQSEAGRITDIVRHSYPDGYLRTSIFSSRSVHRYVAEQVALHPHAEELYCVATRTSRVVGVAITRRVDAGVFLNHICVDLPERGRQLGSRLLRFALEQYQRDHPASVSLDVYLNNHQATKWYEGLGFEESMRSQWCVIPRSLDAAPSSWFMSGYPQAKAVHRVFGFSRFVLATPSRVYEIGCIGSDTVRTRGIADDEAAKTAVFDLLPGRALLSLEESSTGGAVLAPVVRMSASYATVVDRLLEASRPPTKE